jgi:alpha-L-rhamnosidase
MQYDAGPTRERRGYLGDGQIAAETMSSYFEMASTYRHFLTTIKDAQNAVGAVPAKTPPYPPALYYNNDAGWTVGYPLIVQIMLRRYNDTQTVVKHYPHLLRLWQNVSSFVPSDGPYANLWVDVDRDGSFINGDLGDWNALNDEWPLDLSKANQGHVPSALIATFWLIEFAKAMEIFTDVVLQQQHATGTTTTTAGTATTTAGSAHGIDPSQFSLQASLSTKALHARFWNTTLQRYSVIGREPPASLSRFPHGNAHHPPSQTLQALPLWANLTPAADQSAAMTALTDSIEKTDYHLLTGIVGTKYILPALARHGKLDVAMRILTEISQPSFGYWTGPENNLTPLMEDWRSSAAMAYGSKNHIMVRT